MKILVCMKAVPATSQVGSDEQFRLQRSSTELTWNVADESALALALSLRAQGGEVTVLTMGPEKLAAMQTDLFGRGADRVVLLTDRALAGADTIATASALSAAVRYLGGFDLILCGRRAIDGETGQTPAMLASALEIPCVTDCERVEFSEGTLQLRRRLEEGTQVLSVRLPAAVSLCEYAYRLPMVSLTGLRAAKGKQIERLTAADLGFAPGDCGYDASPTRVVKMEQRFPGLRSCRKETSAARGAQEILRMAKEAEA